MDAEAGAERRGLVLGGGGVAGVAWELGLLTGLAERGVDLARADVVVGTSAGAVVGATLLHGGLAGAYRNQAVPVEVENPGMGDFSLEGLMAALATAVRGSGSEEEARARIGAYARAAPAAAIPETDRVALIGSLLPSPEWPPGDLRVTAVDAMDGRFAVYDSSSGIPLAVALTASCAVPGVGPTMTINGRPYMDGGMRSATNADVAQDCDRVLVVACLPEAAEGGLGPSLTQAVTQLRRHAQVLVVEADPESRTAFGTNPLLMSTRGAAAAAGYGQAAVVADAVQAFWG